MHLRLILTLVGPFYLANAANLSNLLEEEPQFAEVDIDQYRQSKSLQNEIRRESSVMGAFTAEEETEMLAIHRNYRAGEGASDMLDMEWDYNLASKAAAWISTCNFAHPDREESSEYWAPGQSIHYSPEELTEPPTPAGIVSSWFNERRYYNIVSNMCTAEATKSCGHYIQLVYATTTTVGCARIYCDIDVKERGAKGWLTACNYGKGPYSGKAPYKIGKACTECSTGSMYCVNNLCVQDCNGKSGCSCKAECGVNGVLDDKCSCKCKDGFTGPDCNDICEDTHKRCGKSWPEFLCDRYINDPITYKYMARCPALCRWCTPLP